MQSVSIGRGLLGSTILVAWVVACGSTALPDAVAPETSASAAPKPSSPGAAPSSAPEDAAAAAPKPPVDAGALDAQDAAPPPKPLRFVAVGDVGKGNEGQQKIADAIAAKCRTSGCDFVQLLGDNIYESGVTSPNDPLLQTRFEQPYAQVNVPFWVVLGNHDYGGSGAGTELGKGKNEVDYTPLSTKWKLPAHYWQRTQANVAMFGLDTNLVLFNVAADQERDFPAWIAAATSTWKIAFGHHPYKSNGTHGNAGSYDGLPFVPFVNGSYVKSFLEDHVCGKVDLYVCGHDHSTQMLEDTCKGTPLVVAGAGAEGTELSNTNRAFFQTNVLSFTYFVIEGKKLTMSIVDEKGVDLHTRTLTKP